MLPWFWKYQVLGIPSPLTKSKRNTANAAERTAEGPRSLTWSLASLVRARCAKILEPKVEKGDFGGSGWVDIYHRVSVPISESLLTIMDQHIYVYYHLKIWVLLFSSKQGCFIVNINQRCLFQRLAVLQWVRRLKLTKKNTFDVSPHIRLQPLSFTVSQRTPIFGGGLGSRLLRKYIAIVWYFWAFKFQVKLKKRTSFEVKALEVDTIVFQYFSRPMMKWKMLLNLHPTGQTAQLSSESTRSCPRSHLASESSRLCWSVVCEVDFPLYRLMQACSWMHVNVLLVKIHTN